MQRRLARHFHLGRAKPNAQHVDHDQQASPPCITIKARSPVPLDSSKPSIAQLPDHVIHAILNLLQHVRPEVLQAVALVSSSLYEQARYAQHQNVRLNLDKANHALCRLDLISRLGQAAAVQEIRVVGRKIPSDQDAEDRNQVLARLVDMTPSMTALRDIGWHVARPIAEPSYEHAGTTSTAIPSDLLAALPPASRLHVSCCCPPLEDSHIKARALLRSLEDNPNLVTLSVNVIFMEDLICRDTMRVLKRVLLSCPNLTRLPELDVRWPRGGCFGGTPLDPYPGLGFSGDEKPPPLQELGIVEYPWGIPRHNPGYPIETRETLHWANSFDWSQLTRMNNMPDYILSEMAPHLTALTELAFDEQSWIEMESLDGIFSPLEVLSFSSWEMLGSQLGRITKFASTLRRLRVHMLEAYWRGKHRFISHPDIIHLSENLPNLQHLALDMGRDEETQQWPYAALEAIASFPSLQTVELWFALGGENSGPAPLLTVSSARHIGDYLRGRNENIQRVTLHSGATRPYTGQRTRGLLGDDFYVPGPSWAQQNSVTLEYEMVYDAEAADHRRSSITCLELNSEMNSQLNQFAQGAIRQQKDPAEFSVDDIHLIAALDGPLDKEQWKAWHNTLPEVIAHKADMKRLHDEIEAIHGRLSLRRRLTKLLKVKR